MKSPWNLLFGFGSRKKAAEPQVLASEEHSGPVLELTAVAEHSSTNSASPERDQTPAPKDEVELRPEVLTSPDVSKVTSPDKADIGNAEDSSEADPGETEPLSLEIDDLEGAANEAAVSKSINPRPRKSRKIAEAEAASIALAYAPTVQPAVGRNDLAIQLNDEINVLRQQLAEKLAEQNAQLRLMLKRFDQR